MSTEKKFTPSPQDGRLRLDAYLSRELAGYVSREKIKKAIIRGNVRLNLQPCTLPKTPVEYNDSIELDLNGLNTETKTPVAEKLPLDIIYQDADLAVINKPTGLTVHPCPSCPEGTLVNRLVAHFPELVCSTAKKIAGTRPKTNASDQNSPGAHNSGPHDSDPQDSETDAEDEHLQIDQQGERPGIVHRLDKDTTGLLLVALNEASRLKLSAAFAAREVKKEYLALVYGVPQPAEGSINTPIGRDASNKTRMAVVQQGGREAFSEYRTLYADPAGRFSLLAVRIHTGRTHQIRVHLRHIGHPILGDRLYFDARTSNSPTHKEMLPFVEQIAVRPLLHAWKIAFAHPGIKETHRQNLAESQVFCCPPPEDFYTAALALSRITPKIVLTGNAGCGKSSVLKLLSVTAVLCHWGDVAIWNADKAVAALYEQGKSGWQLLRSAYGQRFVPDEQAGVDKKALFEAMFQDESLRREIEGLIHPLVHEECTAFFHKQDIWNSLQPPQDISSLPKLAVAEIPLYFEASQKADKISQNNAAFTEKSGPLVIGVHCPQKIRAERLKTNRNWADDMIEKMESWQWDETKKMQACDLVLDNSGTLQELEAEVKKILLLIKERYDHRLQNIKKTLVKLTLA